MAEVLTSRGAEVLPFTLPKRWTPLRHHAVQQAYSRSPHRFNVVPSGRRSGKTERFKRKLVTRAISACTDWDPRFFAAAPTRDQAKRIYWDDLKLLTKPFWRQRPGESDLVIPVMTGAEIHVLGMDKPERVEGTPWDGGGLDEFGNMKQKAWTAHVRPALSDRKGWCDFIGVPEGRNHYYDLDLRAESMMKEFGDKSEWGHFHWISADILDADEIAAAKRDLDELTYQQEYEGSFINFEGRCYYPFTRETHTAVLVYNPRAPLILCFDFNVQPGVAAIIQEMNLPRQFQKDAKGGVLLDRGGKPLPVVGTGVIGEVHIPRNSNTPAICNKIISLFGEHQGEVIAYGDATGGNTGTAKISGSDWDLIDAAMRKQFGDRYTQRVKAGNPPERTRVNSLNSRLKTAAGEIRLMVDPVKAPNVVKDFEGTPLLIGGSGEIDKNKDKTLSHMTDGIGYYTDYEFPVVRQGFTVQRISAYGS